MSLEKVLAAYTSPDKETSLKSALADVEDVQALVEEAQKASDDLLESRKDGNFTKEDAEQIRNLTAVTKAAIADQQARVDVLITAGEVEAAHKELKDLKAPAVPEKTEDTEVVEPSAQVAEPAGDAPVEVPKTQVAEAEPVKELVGSGTGSAAFSVAQLPKNTPPPALIPSGNYSNVFAAGSAEKLDTAKAVVEQLRKTYGNYARRGPGNGIMHSVAEYKRPENEAFSVYGHESDQDVIEKVASTPLKWDAAKGQFAAGWCAPEETLYELCPQISSSDGLVDLPQITARRGSLAYTKAPDFATLYANASVGQILTEAQVEAATVKTCIEIDCPPFNTVTLDVNPLCVTGNLLTHAGYPEYEQRFIAEVMAANEHKINANIIGRMVTASTAVVVTAPPGTGPVDTSSASQFLDYASLYATYIRERYRTRLDQVVEVAAPQWYRQHLAADLSRRTGVDMFTAQSRLDAALSERNIRIQWLYDWQNLLTPAAPATPTPAELATIANTRRATVQILVYLPGTFVKAVNPVISLGVLHSAAQLATNQYTALFVEEGFAVIERCWDSLAVTIPICPSGTTGAASGSCDVTP